MESVFLFLLAVIVADCHDGDDEREDGSRMMGTTISSPGTHSLSVYMWLMKADCNEVKQETCVCFEYLRV